VTKENAVKRKELSESMLGKYKHYNGKIVEVIGVGKHTETLERFVIYKEGKDIWLRPEKMFKGKVKVNGKTILRFTKIRQKPK